MPGSARPDGKLVRLVPMTEEQRDWLDALESSGLLLEEHESLAGAMVVAWDAAPSDSVGAVTRALYEHAGNAWRSWNTRSWTERSGWLAEADAAIAALGVPDANQGYGDAHTQTANEMEPPDA